VSRSQAGDETTFGAVVFIATLPVPLLSGVFLPMSLAPVWLRDIAAFNPLAYAVDAERGPFWPHHCLTAPSAHAAVMEGAPRRDLPCPVRRCA
jgi:ABC-type polysaccharide/polyol phosphate export permease